MKRWRLYSLVPIAGVLAALHSIALCGGYHPVQVWTSVVVSMAVNAVCVRWVLA